LRLQQQQEQTKLYVRTCMAHRARDRAVSCVCWCRDAGSSKSTSPAKAKQWAGAVSLGCSSSRRPHMVTWRRASRARSVRIARASFAREESALCARASSKKPHFFRAERNSEPSATVAHTGFHAWPARYCSPAGASVFDLSVCVRPGPSEVAGGRGKTKTKNRGGGQGPGLQTWKSTPPCPWSGSG